MHLPFQNQAKPSFRSDVLSLYPWYSIVWYIISVQPLSQTPLWRASFITVTYFGTPGILGEGEVIKRSSQKTACHVIMYLNVELEPALVAIQKCLILLHDYLGPNTKKLWLHTCCLIKATLWFLYLVSHVKIKYATFRHNRLCFDFLKKHTYKHTHTHTKTSTKRLFDLFWHVL